MGGLTEGEFLDGLQSGCRSLGLPPLDGAAGERLVRYWQELKQWSRKINLIAKGASDQEILEKHFLDSLTLLPHLAGDHPHLLDIGTGAGFPGLVCKAAMPALKVTLVEPRLKRVSFLRHVVRTLALEEVQVLSCRVEDEAMLPSQGGFSHITSRAVNEIRPFLAMSARFCGPGVQVICMKGPRWEEELEECRKAGVVPGRFLLKTRSDYLLPLSGGTRSLLIFEAAG